MSDSGSLTTQKGATDRKVSLLFPFLCGLQSARSSKLEAGSGAVWGQAFLPMGHGPPRQHSGPVQGFCAMFLEERDNLVSPRAPTGMESAGACAQLGPGVQQGGVLSSRRVVLALGAELGSRSPAAKALLGAALETGTDAFALHGHHFLK